jgi:hypothetical protein
MESAQKNENEQDYWEQQAEKPLRKRGRGWWAEIGFSNIALVAVVIAAVALLLLT